MMEPEGTNTKSHLLNDEKLVGMVLGRVVIRVTLHSANTLLECSAK